MMPQESEASPNVLELFTDDLRLVAASRNLLEADLDGPLGKGVEAAGSQLATLLGAEVPAQWPPELFEQDDLERSLALSDQPGSLGWNLWYLITRVPPDADEARSARIVGIAGFGGAPDADGVVMLGYSVVPEERRKGYAAQATDRLTAFAFEDPRTQCVAAETFEALTPSIGVLLKCGFAREGDAATPGAIRFVRHKPPG